MRLLDRVRLKHDNGQSPVADLRFTAWRRPLSIGIEKMRMWCLSMLVGIAVGCTPSHKEPTGPPPSLQQKMERVQTLVPHWVAAGGRHADIVPLGAQVGERLKAGQFREAEGVIDRILAILNTPPSPTHLPTPSNQRPIQGQDIPPSPLPRQITTVLLAPAMNLPKNAVPGLKGFTDAVALGIAGGGNVFAFAIDWDTLELAPGTYNLQERMLNPLTLVVPAFPQLKGVVVVLKMIDSNRRSMPADLQDKAFDDPEVLRRFEAVLDTITAQPSAQRITYLLLGNEVDSYLGSHLPELPAFRTFYQRAVEHLHRTLPGARVGTVLTFDVLARPPVFDALAPLSDMIDYTYYPVIGSRLGDGVWHWQMRPVSEVAADLHALAQRAGNTPFAFTEIGYSASPLNGSSEEQQAAFVHEIFHVLDPYRRQGRVAFLLYHTMYDYPPEFCQPYARQQGIQDSTEFCAFVENLGLRNYVTGAPRKAWDAFVEEATRWQPESH